MPATAKTLHESQTLKQKQPISVPTDTSKTSKTDKPTTSQTAKSTTKSQPIPIAQTLATVIQKIQEHQALHHPCHQHHIETTHQLHLLIHHQTECLH